MYADAGIPRRGLGVTVKMLANSGLGAFGTLLLGKEPFRQPGGIGSYILGNGLGHNAAKELNEHTEAISKATNKRIIDSVI